MLEVDGKEERLTSEEHTHRPPSTNAHKLTTVSNIRLRKFPSDSYSYLRLFVTPFIRASREEHDQGKQALRVRHTNYCWGLDRSGDTKYSARTTRKGLSDTLAA